ncbi:uncharacterized protein E5676_scaffold180G00050 [Cucumis melo var. makuwa]|uniref:Uncharacterized protein n=1 Tax=Cucumis melo var. makuwa TaxID=1194695 RepID=A0A5A7U4T1_CUCMM|nr:uncharacterized protein E6C27_scaffold355G001320 [Cucumis melo var. makuwa]TYJ98129.1 uncharacterized protein E5676_scaffold180G00050 [Cucumis melo var. makuwa]
MGVLRDHHYYDTDMMERTDGVAHAYDCVFRRDYQSDIDIDIDMITSGKMSPRRGGGRGGKGGERTKPEEQPTVQTANLTTFVTQTDLAAMEKRYLDILRDALTPCHATQQTQAAPAQTPVVPQVVPDCQPRLNT